METSAKTPAIMATMVAGAPLGAKAYSPPYEAGLAICSGFFRMIIIQKKIKMKKRKKRLDK